MPGQFYLQSALTEAYTNSNHLEAIKLYKSSLEAKEDNPESAYFYMGNSYQTLGIKDNAIQSYLDAIKIYTNGEFEGCEQHRDACYFVAILSADKAKEQYDKVRAQYDEKIYSSIITNAENVIAYAGDYNRIRGANGEFPENYVKDAWHYKGASLYMKGRYDGALDTYNHAIREYASDAEYVANLEAKKVNVVNDWHDLRIKPLLDAGKEAEAKKEYQAILRRVPGDERAKAGLGVPSSALSRVDSREDLSAGLRAASLGEKR